MIDLKRVRENPEAVRESQRARGEDPALVDELLAADEARRSAIQKADELRSEQKAFGKKIGQAAPEDRPALLEGSNELKARVKEAEAEEAAAQEKLEKLQYSIANMIEGAPAGGEEDFVVLEHVGEVPEFDFEVKDHLDLGEALGIIDMKRGTKVGGARFYYLAGDGAWLQLGMLMLAAQKAREAGFKLMVPPVLVRPDVMQGTGFLDEHDEEIYYLERDDMYLVGTSEVALAGLHQDEIIDLSEGPLLYAGWSSCFRREAGSYGKDTKGILRVHQFDKLEMFAYCKPEDAEEMHQTLLGLEYENYRNSQKYPQSDTLLDYGQDIYRPVYGRPKPPITKPKAVMLLAGVRELAAQTAEDDLDIESVIGPATDIAISILAAR